MEEELEPNDKLHRYSLDEWVIALDRVYGAIDAKRSSEGVLLHLVEHASQIQEDLRIGRYHDAVTHLADAFCWTCGLVVKSANPACYGTQSSYRELILAKFPHRCYHCLQPRCICSATIGAGIEDKAAKDKRREENKVGRKALREQLRGSDDEPTSLFKLERMFNGKKGIYTHVNFATPLDNIVAHFQEEVGEVAECINNLEDARNEGIGPRDTDAMQSWQEELELELADVFTWTTALLAKFDYMLGSANKYLALANAQNEDEAAKAAALPQSLGLTLPKILWTRYGIPNVDPGEGLRLRCPRCTKTPCECRTRKSH